MDTPIDFKFKWVTEEGQKTGIFSTKGRVDRDALVLGEESVPLAAIVRARSRFDVLLVDVFDGKGGLTSFHFAVTSGKLADVQAAVNRTASANWERGRRKAAEEAGGSESLRFETCALCRSRVDVSGKPRTPQVWCPYCERVATTAPDPDPDEMRYRLCDGCGYYGSPVRFTSAFFWFAFVVWGYSSKDMQVCRSCMRAEAWAMLGKNAIFVVGVPFALMQLVRAYASGRLFEGKFAGLDAANARAKAKKSDEAATRYLEIESRLRRAAGVAYCRGLGHEAGGHIEAAAAAHRDALDAASNFPDAYRRLAACLRRLGRATELEALRRSWDDDEAWEKDRKLLAEQRAAGAVGAPPRRTRRRT